MIADRSDYLEGQLVGLVHNPDRPTGRILAGKGEDDRPAAPVYVQFAKDVEAAQDEIERQAVETWQKAVKGGEKRIKVQRTMIPRLDGNSPTGYSYIVTEQTSTEETMFPDWRSAVAWLERCLPEFYALPRKHRLSGKDGGPIPVIVLPALQGPTDEQIMAVPDRKLKAG